jgi:hypothetical protein
LQQTGGTPAPVAREKRVIFFCFSYWTRGFNGGELACALTHLATWARSAARAAAGEEVYNTIIFKMMVLYKV